MISFLSYIFCYILCVAYINILFFLAPFLPIKKWKKQRKKYSKISCTYKNIISYIIIHSVVLKHIAFLFCLIRKYVCDNFLGKRNTQIIFRCKICVKEFFRLFFGWNMCVERIFLKAFNFLFNWVPADGDTLEKNLFTRQGKFVEIFVDQLN